MKATAGLTTVGNADNNELAYTGDGLVIYAFPKSGVLFAASKSDDRLRQFEQDSGVELDWL